MRHGLIRTAFHWNAFHRIQSCNTSLRHPSHQLTIQRRHLLTLAIETSCDDTAVAILEKHVTSDGTKPPRTLATLHFNERLTLPNNGWGGIHPIESLAWHRKNLANLVSRALLHLPRVSADGEHVDAGTALLYGTDGVLRRKPDFVSVTRGPGMRSNVACGLDLAKGLSVAWGVPLLGIHHMQAHALTARLASALRNIEEGGKGRQAKERSSMTLEFPFLTLLVSGGHTMLVLSENLTSHTIIADTRDVAIGDALDKCGRLILPSSIQKDMKDTAYAKHLSKFAFPSTDTFKSWPIPRSRSEEIEKPANEYGWQIQAPLSNTKELAFSFSGFASIVENISARKLG